MRPSFPTLLVLLFLLLPALPAGAQQGSPCRAAIEAAERERGIPPRLLTAIALVESGRRDPETGAFHPWPWTVNAEGVGSFHPTKEAAIAQVRALQARGVRSIDVGCMQVNLRHHPKAFANLDDAFDPAVNARYAGQFLASLYKQTGNWNLATANYHSQNPERGEDYQRRVFGRVMAPMGAATAAGTPAKPAGPYAAWPPPGVAFGALPPATFAFGAFSAPPNTVLVTPLPHRR